MAEKSNKKSSANCGIPNRFFLAADNPEPLLMLTHEKGIFGTVLCGCCCYWFSLANKDSDDVEKKGKICMSLP